MKFHNSTPRTTWSAAGAVVAAILSLSLSACGGSGGGSGSAAVHPGCTSGNNDALPKLQSAHKIGFSQNALDGAWRNAEEASIEQEAAQHGYQLIHTNANNSDDQQAQDINTLVNDGVDALIVAPHTEDAEVPAIINARKHCIPVFLVDRNVNLSLASPGKDFVTFMGSDFEKQGQRAADAMIEAVGGPDSTADIVELKGTTGASPAILRGAGFEEELAAKAPKIHIVAAQTADFDRTKGQQVMATLIQQFPNIKGVYAHNDEMAIGAITALKAAGKKPGPDVKVVSIDGTKDAVNEVIAGEQYAVIESNPHFGKLSFDTLQQYMQGTSIPAWIVVQDRAFKLADGSAKAYLPEAF